MHFARYGFFIVGFAFAIALPLSVSAHTPRFVNITQHGATLIEEPEVSQAFYGELDDFPHLFEIESDEDFELSIEILSPDIEGALTTDLAVIALKRKTRGVDTVVRLRGSEAAWDSKFEFFGGDSYLHGASFKERVPAGKYAIEVSTPVNKGKYVLVVGSREEFAWSNYFGTLRDIMQVKEFFGKSKWAILQSPFAYVPLLLILCVAGFFGARAFRSRK